MTLTLVRIGSPKSSINKKLTKTSGAMENWVSPFYAYTSNLLVMCIFQGLITGRITSFLLDPKNVDQVAKNNVARVQCHEVAHMWYASAIYDSLCRPFMICQ